MALLRSRRVMLGFGVLLVSPALSGVAWSKREDAQPGTSLAGQLLVATPEMCDPRFSHAVILMVQHNKDGALGIVINRPVEEVPVAKLLDALGLDSKGSDGTVRLFAGGPVQPQIGFIVHQRRVSSPGYHRHRRPRGDDLRPGGAARHRPPSRARSRASSRSATPAGGRASLKAN